MEARCLAIWALGNLGDPSVAPRLGKILEDPDQDVRGKACGALRNLKERSVLPQVAGLLDHKDPKVQEIAATAIAAILSDSGLNNVAAARAWWGQHKGDPDFQAK